MKALTFQGVERIAFEDVAEPALLDSRDALVRVRWAGLCGSDLHPYFGRETGLDVGTVLGHELVGEVVALGEAARRRADAGPAGGWAGGGRIELGATVVAPFTTACGACWFCSTGLTARCTRGQLFGWVEGGRGLHGAQAELVRVPLADSTLVRVPGALEDPALAVLAGDILSTALFGAHAAGVAAGDTVAVVGCGPVGLLGVRAALAAGAERVFAVVRVPSRLALAERFGATPLSLDADDPVAAVREATDGRGADAAIEAVGSAAATRTAADLLRPGATLAALGVHTEPHLALPPGELYDRNLTYVAGRCSARRWLPAALELAAREAGLLSHLISHRLPLSRGVEAYGRFAAREEGWAKVLLLP